MSQVCIADALRATQIQLSYQQMFYYCWNQCIVCSISMLEYASETNTKQTAYPVFITKVFIQGLAIFDFSYIYPFIFLTYFPKSTLTLNKSKIQVVFGVFVTPFFHARSFRSLKMLLTIYILFAKTLNSKGSFWLETFQVQNLTNFFYQKNKYKLKKI